MAAAMTTQQARAMLQAIGFDNVHRNFTAAVSGFQAGWNLGPPLAVDSNFGPLTSAALATSFARHRKGQSTMSAHFSYTEFRCKCGGAFSDCQRIWALRTQVRRLEAYRAKIGAAVRIISGCRCKGRNQAVGGAKLSQHLFGAASDIEGHLTLAQMRQIGLFAGLGYKSSNNKVVHADSRDTSGHNSTSGSPAHPTEWKYAT